MTAPVHKARPNGAGKLVVVGMLLVAALAGGFAWWWNYNRGRRAMEFYGPEAARLIRTAPTVEILVTGESGDAAEAANGRIPELNLPIERRIDVSSARGLIHARTSLLDDASYQLDATPTPQAFCHFVRFADGGEELVLAFSEPDGNVMRLTGDPTSRTLKRKTADGWRSFIERNLRDAEASDAGPSPQAGNGDQFNAETF